MYRINKLREDNVLHFAAEELKKYLRMMMPDCGEIDISLDPKATEGFRLGLLEDFGLPCEAELEEIKEITAEARAFIKTHLAMPTRPQTVSWRLLLRHTEWCEKFAQVLIEVCKGHTKYAMEKFQAFAEDFGKYDFEMERYFDFGLAYAGLLYIVKNVPKVEF